MSIWNGTSSTSHGDFPAPFVHLQMFGLPLWRWIGIVLAIVLAIFLSSVVTRFLLLIARHFLHKKHIQDEEKILSRLNAPLRVVLLSLAAVVSKSFSISVFSPPVLDSICKNIGRNRMCVASRPPV